jgi:hypothetical protein
MAFESRGSAGNYFYLGVRDRGTGKVRKLYLGTGDAARSVAASIADRKSRQAADRRAVQEAQEALRSADALTAELDGAATLLMEAVLLAGGWHRPNYGPWRRKRDGHGGHGAGPAAGRAG